MTEPVKPALTQKEWKRPDVDISLGMVWVHLEGRLTGEVEAMGEKPPFLGITWQSANNQETIFRRHALAALALHGQPFGFTREMFQALKRLAESDLHDEVADNGDGYVDTWCSMEREQDIATLREVAARIEALLPPEDTQ